VKNKYLKIDNGKLQLDISAEGKDVNYTPP